MCVPLMPPADTRGSMTIQTFSSLNLITSPFPHSSPFLSFNRFHERQPTEDCNCYYSRNGENEKEGDETLCVTCYISFNIPFLLVPACVCACVYVKVLARLHAKWVNLQMGGLLFSENPLNMQNAVACLRGRLLMRNT